MDESLFAFEVSTNTDRLILISTLAWLVCRDIKIIGHYTQQCENEAAAWVHLPGGCSGCSDRCMNYHKQAFLGSFCRSGYRGDATCICCIAYREDEGIWQFK